MEFQKGSLNDLHLVVTSAFPKNKAVVNGVPSRLISALVGPLGLDVILDGPEGTTTLNVPKDAEYLVRKVSDVKREVVVRFGQEHYVFQPSTQVY